MTAPIEKRAVGEASLQGRTVTGKAMVYGKLGRTPSGIAERFMPGAFGLPDDVILNASHDDKQPLARTNGGGLELDDNRAALEVRAHLPNTRAADDTLELVRSGVMRGLSVEFRALTERVVSEGGQRIREIHRAQLLGIAIVARPAYGDTDVQARAVEPREPAPWVWSV